MYSKRAVRESPFVRRHTARAKRNIERRARPKFKVKKTPAFNTLDIANIKFLYKSPRGKRKRVEQESRTTKRRKFFLDFSGLINPNSFIELEPFGQYKNYKFLKPEDFVEITFK